MAATVSSVVYNATDFFRKFAGWRGRFWRYSRHPYTCYTYIYFSIPKFNRESFHCNFGRIETFLSNKCKFYFVKLPWSISRWSFVKFERIPAINPLQLNWTFIWLHLVGIVWISRKVVDFVKVSGSLFVLFPPYLPSHWNFFHLIKPPNFYSYIISNGLSLSQYISSNSKVSLVSVVFWRWMRATIKKGAA